MYNAAASRYNGRRVWRLDGIGKSPIKVFSSHLNPDQVHLVTSDGKTLYLNPRGFSVHFDKLITQTPFLLDVCITGLNLDKACQKFYMVPEKINRLMSLYLNSSVNTNGSSCKMLSTVESSSGPVWTVGVVGQANESATVQNRFSFV